MGGGSGEPRMPDAETQLASFFAKYDGSIAKLGKALRAELRDRLPGLLEIVYFYENQDALVIAYSPTERGIDGVCSLALYPRELKLFFAKGPLLSKSDPGKLLKGSGKMVRYVELSSVADFERAEIEALLAAALRLSKVRLDARAKGSMILKAQEQKRRANRAATTARRAAPHRAAKPRR